MTDYAEGRIPPKLRPCPKCSYHVYPDTDICPHCGAPAKALIAARDAALEKFFTAARTLERLIVPKRRPN